MDKRKEIHDALRRIGLALNMSNNLIVTDYPPEVEPKGEKFWRTDHFQEIEDLDYIEKVLIDAGLYFKCDCCNKKLKGEK